MSFLKKIGNFIGKAISPISSIASSVSGILGNRAQRKENDRQRDFERQSQSIQMGHDWNMWHANNKYNSPVEQMQRLRDAGVNPHLAYMQGSMAEASSLANNSIGGSSGVGSMNTNPLSGSDLYRQYLENKNIELQNNKVEAETDNVKANTEATTGEEGRNKDLHSGNLEKQQAEIDELKSKYKLTDFHIKEIEQKIEESKRKVLLMISQQSNIEQDTDLKKEQEKLYKSQKDYYIALTHNVGFEQWAKTQQINIEKDRHEIAKLMFYLDYEMKKQGIKGILYDNMNKEETLKGKRIQNQKNSNYTANSTLGQLFLDGIFSFFGNFGTFVNTALGGFSSMVNTAYGKSIK